MAIPALMAALAAPAIALAETDALARLKAAGETKVAVGSAPPFVGLASGGEPIGYAVEVVNAALVGLGLAPISPVKTDWSAMIPGMQAMQYDFVAPGLTNPQDRCDVAICSGPVWSMQFGIFLPSDNPKKITDVASMAARPEAKLAVITGSSQDAYAVAAGLSDAQLVRVTDIQSGVSAVKGGRAEAFLVGQFSVPTPGDKGLAVGVEVASPVFGYGVAFRKEDTALRDAFDQQLDRMRQDGSLEELYSKKYGIENWDAYILQTHAADVYPNCT